MVDCIASLATMPFEMDGWRVDVAVSGSQKGLMTPPGLSFVAAGPRALAAHRGAGLRTRYWDWTERDGEQHYQKYCGTPPEHLLFGLRRALDLLLAEGLDNVVLRHRLLAEAVRRAVAVWAEGGVLELNIVAPAERANSVTTVLVGGGHQPATPAGVLRPALRRRARRRHRPLERQGPAHRPHGARQRADDPRHAGALEIGLVALGIAHGKGGLQAAIDWLGQRARGLGREVEAGGGIEPPIRDLQSPALPLCYPAELIRWWSSIERARAGQSAPVNRSGQADCRAARRSL